MLWKMQTVGAGSLSQIPGFWCSQGEKFQRNFLSLQQNRGNFLAAPPCATREIGKSGIPPEWEFWECWRRHPWEAQLKFQDRAAGWTWKTRTPQPGFPESCWMLPSKKNLGILLQGRDGRLSLEFLGSRETWHRHFLGGKTPAWECLERQECRD